nr:reverse transcriptase domain-containing protein [Tanacetum cinerariifolium]
MPRECLAVIESKSKVRYLRNKPVVAKVSTNTSTSGISPDVTELKDMVKALLLDKKSQNQAPATVKAVEESCVTCGGAHSYRNCPATNGNVYRDNIQEFISQASAVNYNQGNTSYRPLMMSNQIRPPGPVYQPPVFQPPAYQAPAYQAPSPQTQGILNEDFSAYVKANDAIMRNMQTQGQNMQNQLTNLNDLLTKFVNSNNASTSSSGTLPSNTIANPRSDLKAITTRSGVSYDGPQIPPPPSFLPKVVKNKPEATKDIVHPTNNRSTEDVQPQVVQSKSPILTSEPVNSPIIEPKLRDKANDQCEKIFQIFKDLNFNISFTDALILMPKFGPSIKSYLTNKDELCELARTPLNEHCSAVLLNKLPEQLGDPDKFLIPCDFPRKAECLALADLGARINLMPLPVWNKHSLPDLTPTCMTLELADRSIYRLVGVAEDVYVKVGTFHFSADFIVIDFDADPRVPLIPGRYFLKTGRALIDVFEGELTLRVGKEAITFNLDQTLRYSANYNDMMAKRIDVINMACEEYSHDFLLEEVDAFLALDDDPTSPEVDQSYLDSEGDILLLEAFLNDDPSLPPPNQGNYLPEVELKDLPPHLEYTFLEGDDKFPVIIAKDLSVEEKTALITRGVNPKIHDVIKQEVLKLLDAGLIYPISDSPWVSPIHCVPKKGGFTFVENEDNELILTHLVTGWRVCIDYRKLNEATRKDHFPLPFMDQMLERLAGNQYYCFLDGFSGYFQIPIDLKDQEKTTFTCTYGTFAYRRMPFGLCNAPGTFQRCMMAIFQDMIEKTMEVFMDDFLIFEISLQSCLSHLERMRKRKLTEAPILIAPDWDMPFELMCDASDFSIGVVLGQRQDKYFRPIHYAKFTFKVIDTKGVENLAADHLSRLENPHQNVLDPKEVKESFPLETLNLVSTRGNSSTLWFADFTNYHAGNFVVKGVYTARKPLTFSRLAIIDPSGDTMAQITQLRRCLIQDSIGPPFTAFRTAYKTPSGRTPYKLVYEKACHLPFELEHKAYWALKHANFNLQTAANHRKVQLNQLPDQAYENSLICKEKTKRLHDSKIKDRVFNIGDRVLLLNSRLKIFSGKLKSRCSGPFTISYVYLYGTIELAQPDGPNFKVNGHRLKHYFGEEVPKLVVLDLQTFLKDH